jgi:serine-type D-Ala-D-Ala carboxypeptidase (penicillin-binding protein 5/6)
VTQRSVLNGGRRRRRRRPGHVLVVLVLGALAAWAVDLTRDAPRFARGPQRASLGPAPAPAPSLPLDPHGPAPLAGGGTEPSPLSIRLDAPRDPIRLRFRHPPRSGLLFDIDTGRVLWRRAPTRVLPIASLTKMMTALLVAERLPRKARVPITREALRYRGSGVGLLPRGKRIAVDTMLHGLLLPSGNDAAIALAQRAAGGSMARFVGMMNGRARAMGMLCTRFSRPDGYRDRGNHSCAGDLAVLARAVLRVPRLARIVRRRSAVLPFPIKGGRIYLYNNNPLLRSGYRGITGLKTGYTNAAGPCLVATARRRGRRLGVVLLHSPDPAGQAQRLLDRGWRVRR